MAGQPTPPMQAKERQIYRTYADKKDRIFLASMYSGANQGFHGYVGGILFVQWTSGGTVVKIRNYASQAYPTAANTDGTFDFDYNNILSVQAQIYTNDVSNVLNQSRGVTAFVDVPGKQINLYFFDVVAGVVSPYVLTSNDAVHIEVLIQKNSLTGVPS